jgi:hypothetical protein
MATSPTRLRGHATHAKEEAESWRQTGAWPLACTHAGGGVVGKATGRFVRVGQLTPMSQPLHDLPVLPPSARHRICVETKTFICKKTLYERINDNLLGIFVRFFQNDNYSRYKAGPGQQSARYANI